MLVVAGWLVLGLLEGHGYAPGRHDISDLGSLTAHHATWDRLTTFVSGGVTIVAALAADGTPVQGWAQRAAVLVVVSGVVALAGHVVRLGDRAPVSAGR